jgi:hypothetical protein
MATAREPHQAPRGADERHLRIWLQQMDHLIPQDLTARGYAYRNTYHFLLAHGRWYPPRPLPARYGRGAPQQCYTNATLAGIFQGLRYVEGWALHVIPTPHAWATDARGRLYELTWETPGRAYLGVEFALERADAAACDRGSVLDNWVNHYALLREPWTGERPGSPDHPTRWLTLVRRGQFAEARQWVRTHWLTEKGDPHDDG